MKITIIDYRYREAGSIQYQTVEPTIEVIAQIEEGDVASQVIASLRNRTGQWVQADVEQALVEILGTSN